MVAEDHESNVVNADTWKMRSMVCINEMILTLSFIVKILLKATYTQVHVSISRDGLDID